MNGWIRMLLLGTHELLVLFLLHLLLLDCKSHFDLLFLGDELRQSFLGFFQLLLQLVLVVGGCFAELLEYRFDQGVLVVDVLRNLVQSQVVVLDGVVHLVFLGCLLGQNLFLGDLRNHVEEESLLEWLLQKACSLGVVGQ